MYTNNDMQVSIKDFQIIKKASLTFSPGLTAIIGQSNNGKSAIFRAIKSCIYNEPGTNSVRNGCSSYAVGISMNNHTVICQKGNGNLYKIDGQIYQKVGRTQLPEVADLLNIKQLNINNSNEQLNFWDQMEKPFLLDRSETDLFRFIVDTGKDNNITSALKTLTSDRQGLTKEITKIEGMLEQAELNIKAYEDKLKDADKTLELCNKIIQIGSEISRLHDSKKYVNNLELTKASYDKANLDFNNKEMLLSKITPVAEQLNNKTKLSNVATQLVNTYSTKSSSLELFNKRISAINNLDTTALTKDNEQYNYISKAISNYQEVSSNFELTQKIKIPEIREGFKADYDKYILGKNLVNNYNFKDNDVKTSENNIVKLNEAIEDLKKEINEIGVCPTCGQPIHS